MEQAKVDEARLEDYARILAPVITEKTSVIQGADGGEVVAFYVDRRSDKLQIRRAVECIFKVKVASVRTCNRLGKIKRTTRAVGRTKQYKKAYVTLKPGFTIGIVEGV